jgi:hypothetical protein
VRVLGSSALTRKDICCVRAAAEFYRQGSQSKLLVEDGRQKRGHSKIRTDTLNSARSLRGDK